MAGLTIASDPRVKSSLQQQYAETGNLAPSSIMQQIIHGTLDTEAANMANSYALKTAQDAETERVREFEAQQQQAADARKSAGVQSAVTSGAQLATTYALSNSHVIANAANAIGNYITGANPTIAGTEGLSQAGSQIGSTGMVDTGISTMPAYIDATPAVPLEGSPAVAATSESSGALASASGVGAIIGATEIMKNKFGGENPPMGSGWNEYNRTWEDKDSFQRFTSAPGIFGFAPWAALAPNDTFLGDLGKNLATAERIMLKPIDWVFGAK